MKRIAIAILALAFLVEPAFVYAQQSDQDARERAAEKKKEEDNPLLKEYHEQQKENARIEQRYQRVLRATDSRAAPKKVDPWANLRGGSSSKR
jgi:hypothetical protein